MNINIDINMASTEVEIGIKYCAQQNKKTEKKMQNNVLATHTYTCYFSDIIAGLAIIRTAYGRRKSSKKIWESYAPMWSLMICPVYFYNDLSLILDNEYE